jgi:cytosine/adenosine deaminase-related metal-dependent hydrolase
MAVYLSNVNWVDPDTFEMHSGNLKVSEDLVEFVDSVPADAMDCQGKLVTRSFACGHHHAYSALATGMPGPEHTPQDFHEILQYVWWNLDKKLDHEIIRASALVTAMNCALNGVTFVIDHHASPFAAEGSLEIIARTFDEIGVGHLLCYEISDRDGALVSEAGFRETETYLQERLGLVGLHASFTVRDATLKKAVELAEKYNSGIHIHAAEDPIDQDLCYREHGCRVIERLDQHGVLQFDKSILAHALHINNHERKLLAGSAAWVAVNTESNLNNEVGLFDGIGLNPLKLMLGTDGMHSDMIRSAQYHYFSHKRSEDLSPAEAYHRLRHTDSYLERNGFRNTASDIVILDYQPATPLTAQNYIGHFFYGFSARNVESVISNGRLIVDHRNLTTGNETDIREFGREQAARLWKML